VAARAEIPVAGAPALGVELADRNDRRGVDEAPIRGFGVARLRDRGDVGRERLHDLARSLGRAPGEDVREAAHDAILERHLGAAGVLARIQRGRSRQRERPRHLPALEMAIGAGESVRAERGGPLLRAHEDPLAQRRVAPGDRRRAALPPAGEKQNERDGERRGADAARDACGHPRLGDNAASLRTDA
jgi:hypothetical protein